MARIGRNQFIKLQKRYKTDEAIAKLYGLSRQAIHQLRNRYRIFPVPNKNKERNDQIIGLHKKGVSIIKLAKKFKLSVTHIYRIVKNISPNK